MAILALLLGGIAGFIGFLSTFFMLEYSFAAAFWVYICTGFASSLLIVASTCLPGRMQKAEGKDGVRMPPATCDI